MLWAGLRRCSRASRDLAILENDEDLVGIGFMAFRERPHSRLDNNGWKRSHTQSSISGWGIGSVMRESSYVLGTSPSEYIREVDCYGRIGSSIIWFHKDTGMADLQSTVSLGILGDTCPFGWRLSHSAQNNAERGNI